MIVLPTALYALFFHANAIDVQRWASGGAGAGEPVRILRTDTGAASGWSGELESVLHAHAERRDAAQTLIRLLLEPLNAVHIRDACNPSRTGGLDLVAIGREGSDGILCVACAQIDLCVGYGNLCFAQDYGPVVG